ncbi:UDP-N-acetylmuramoyl-L-alanyl-D-glutamate--2,6-diaminopimelate ligase [Bifidobacterium sp. ESL0800]|uniref:UDP-N-acetylmuramoyl-L-alanyl-D-glutamate--2, 6-diaminopimelate ligase n=1 Tax=Bifidobacterium sp. ESL0800 TaxID=2983236 RepID=UPI0023F8085F|nr:UDP-N-acetylmuramoyl-L-alanyl-D-glutamate--2,6-diaminopimelate ligase [Bifidobacterium sp. ESL0800]WEV76441.1 UDP-N-acetylmuramoyl-L-alanyl-D-glutamate--2,6-diaminopimelate ligase [Bifidobacterium sp. ESL0800]
MALSVATAVALLDKHHLLREIIQDKTWSRNPARFAGADEAFTSITYDTRQVQAGTLLCCKGHFKTEYLSGCDERGLKAYVSETDFSADCSAVGIIVTDIRKAMSLLSAQFYGRPQDELALIGITGTKGKTTTAYFVQAILNTASDGKAALFSSVDNCLDGHTYTASALTTPESMDAFRMMRQAVDNGMRYLVMEVSSQAYKVDRVYGLNFDVGAFLNISPDHISPIEHPTFEDYLYCKRQITTNSKALVLGADCDHADLIEEDAAAAHVPVTTFALHSEGRSNGAEADTVAWPADRNHTAFHIDVAGADMPSQSRTGTGDPRSIADPQSQGADATDLPDGSDIYKLDMDGDFNYANAAAALTIARIAGANLHYQSISHALENVRISGRMEQFKDSHGHNIAIVDYAHNFASVSALIDFVVERYEAKKPRITLVSGSAGGKAVDRRQEIIEAAQHRVDRIIITTDDPDRERAEDICETMQAAVTDPNVHSSIVVDRQKAVETAIAEARAHDGFDVILIVGKGEEQWLKVDGRHAPYEGDTSIVTRLFS